MPTKFEVAAPELGTIVITASFTDENGVAVTPSTCAWMLVNSAGTVINGRSSVSLVPAPTVTVALTGDDLSMLEAETGETAKRYFVLRGTYTSTLGSLAFADYCTFYVRAIPGVS